MDRAIGIPDPGSSVEETSVKHWMRKRLGLIRRLAGRFTPPLVCHFVEQNEQSFTPCDFNDLWRVPEPDCREERREFPPVSIEPKTEESPSLDYLINQCKVTALVALNDNYARDYYLWLKLNGIRIPQDLSLIGFDNSNVGHPFGLTTVDMGHNYLGHQAAGILTGRIPVPSGRPPTVRARLWLIERSTVRDLGG